MVGQTIVIINDNQIAVELLNKRSELHSPRPNLVFASRISDFELWKKMIRNDTGFIRLSWEHILAMQTYSERFRIYRKAMQPYLGSEAAIAQYNSFQEIEVHRFLLRVLQGPSKLSQPVQT